MKIIGYDQVASRVLEVRNNKVILDSDVADLYGVETRVINQAVSRNFEKFPLGYIIELNHKEWIEVKSQVVTSPAPLGGGKVKLPKAFTEKGLYMLATILKSPKAIQTTIAIIDTFAHIKQLTNKVNELAVAKTESQKVAILEQGIDLFTDLLDNELITSQQETEIKIKLPFLEFTRKITKVKK